LLNYPASHLGEEHRNYSINILGTRGIPAAHGGFESFAAKLAPYLRDKGWNVTVYCQHEANDRDKPLNGFEDYWEGIRRVHFVSHVSGPLGTIEFDWACIRHVLSQPGIDLILGYNTAIFALINRLWSRKVIMNMDGIEWKRAKWGRVAKAWFWLNEILGIRLCHVPVADNPEIAKHLQQRGCRHAIIIPYGSDEVKDADASLIRPLGLEPDNYFVTVCRIEPENSILEIVRGFSAASTRLKLAVIGKLSPETNEYHAEIRRVAGDDILFPGAIYDAKTISALRFHARAYLHGHQVGGTNPSLVEALGAGNTVAAHDNPFNRWVGGSEQFYFRTSAELSEILVRLATDEALVTASRIAARKRHAEAFLWSDILSRYEEMCRLVESGVSISKVLGPVF
jgi:glycosyltransferase involved in cell wall biosynthesis